MVPVQMGDEDCFQLMRRKPGPHQLDLGCLPAVEEPPLALADDGQGADVPLQGRPTRTGPKWNDAHATLPCSA